MSDEIGYMSATELTAKYQRLELSPVEVTKYLLDRVEDLNPILNMMYLITPDSALDEAKASEKRWRSGTPKGLLDGVPTTTKDGLLTKGLPTYRGSAANHSDDETWTIDAPVVARLKEQGAVFLGKTTMPDFGILASGTSSKHGVTRNPWNLQHNTGGSSSGTAATLAAGISPIAVGTDIVGSVRLPASFCGLFGHKPSQGRVPYYPPSAPTLVAGPMSRTVTDSALLMNVISQPDRRDFTALAEQQCNYTALLETPIRKTRIGLLTDIGFGPTVDPEVKRHIEAAAKVFEDLGYYMEELTTPFKSGDDACAERFYRTRCYTELMNFPVELREKAPAVHDWASSASEFSATELYRAMDGMRSLRERTMRIFDKVDYLLLPSVAVPAYGAEQLAPNPEQLFAPWSNTFLFNITEQPAASINCGYTTLGLPIGLQIVGPRFDDMGVLRLSRTYEKVRPQQRPYPTETLSDGDTIQQRHYPLRHR